MSAEFRLSDEVIARFLSNVQEVESGCTEWTSAKSNKGYGYWSHPRRTSVWAHRFSYEMFVGAIPEGYQIDHLCKNTSCVKPDHLEAVTPEENNRRSDSPTGINARKTECIRGHAFDEENTYWTPRGRHCRACKRLYDKPWSVMAERKKNGEFSEEWLERDREHRRIRAREYRARKKAEAARDQQRDAS